MKLKVVRKINIDEWRKVYSVVIPSVFVVIYIAAIALMRFNVIDSYSIIDSKNINNMLEAIITFVSIVIGVFGFLLPILITNKKDCGMVEFFLKKADKEKFIIQLKYIIIGGFSIVVIASMLFLNDILIVSIIDILVALLIWLIIFFMCNAYRFISLLLSLLITDKEDTARKVKNQMNDKQISELNNKLKNKSNV